MQQRTVGITQYTILNSFSPHFLLHWPLSFTHISERLKAKGSSLLEAERKQEQMELIIQVKKCQDLIEVTQGNRDHRGKKKSFWFLFFLLFLFLIVLSLSIPKQIKETNAHPILKLNVSPLHISKWLGAEPIRDTWRACSLWMPPSVCLAHPLGPLNKEGGQAPSSPLLFIKLVLCHDEAFHPPKGFIVHCIYPDFSSSKILKTTALLHSNICSLLGSAPNPHLRSSA